MEEVLFCPGCGGNLSDKEYAARFRQPAYLDWTGKVRCPVCGFFGFFLKAAPSEISKMQFRPKARRRDIDYNNPEVVLAQEHTGWLAFIIAITVVAALAYFLLSKGA